VTAADHPVRAGFQDALASGPLLLSGALGTELLRCGVPTPLPLWAADALLNAPKQIRRIHADYVAAGARIVTANTFRADRVTLAKAGLAARTRELNKLAVKLAREGIATARPTEPIFVAGSVAPVADCYEPGAVPDEQTLRIEHGIRVGHLIAAGAALVLVETMNTIREAEAALGACNAGNIPGMVSFVCGADGRLLSGESLADAAAAVEPYDPLAILVNCCAPKHATKALDALLENTTHPAGVYANGVGRPDETQGWIFKGGTKRRRYKKEARRWLKMGAQLLGGCCGTDPSYIRALRRLL